MFRRLFFLPFLIASLSANLPASAQTAASEPINSPTPAQPERKQLSSHLTQAIREKLPAYTVIEEKTSEPVPVPETAPETVVLEKRIVRGEKSLTFTEHELASKAGLAALLRKRYPGASVPPESRAPNYAALMYADDLRLEQIAKFESVAENLRATGDIKASKELKKEISRAFIRGHDWKTESMDRSANNNRR